MTTHEIKLKIHEEAELFSPMDPDQNQLSEEAVSYLSRNFLNRHRSSKDKYVLHIFSDTPADEQHIRNSFINYFQQEKDLIDDSLRRLTLKEICLGALGIILLAVWLFLSARSENVGVEVLSIMGWVTIWEAASIAIMERPELRRVQKSYSQLLQSDIHVICPQKGGQQPVA